MRTLDPLLFLAGHRGAIERIAATRHAWIIGAILVLTAGIARNYDHLDLLREPEWFIGPFAASMVSISFIFICIIGPLKLAAAGKLAPQFLAFLTFAWMTAPCAWLYGIPVEAMTDIITATKWNIAFLAIVAFWRVILMMRAVALLTGVSHLRAFLLVLAPAAFEAMVGTAVKGMSLVQIMGGVRLPPHTQVLQNASFFVAHTSFWIFLASVIGCWAIQGKASRPLHREATRAGRGAAIVSAVAWVVWLVVGWPFQPAVRNRLELLRLIHQQQYHEAAEFATVRQRADFPLAYAFPPGADGFPTGLLDATSDETPAWLREEWQTAAIESLTSYPVFSRESLSHLHSRHPQIARALAEHAMNLRSERSLDHSARWWLHQYESATDSSATAAPFPEDP